MWAALAAGLHAGRFKPFAYQRVEAGTAGKAPIRGSRTNEDLSGIRLGQTSTQIREQRVANRWQQWQDGLGTRLGMVNTEAIGTPVDVIQPQSSDLAGAQPVGGKKQHDGVVTQALRGSVLAGCLLHGAYLLRAQRRGDRLECVERGRHHAEREVAGGSACVMSK